MKSKELPITLEEGGELDTKGFIRMLANAITKGDPVGYLKSIEERANKEAKNA